jgi:hypothetical protein
MPVIASIRILWKEFFLLMLAVAVLHFMIQGGSHLIAWVGSLSWYSFYTQAFSLKPATANLDQVSIS